MVGLIRPSSRAVAWNKGVCSWGCCGTLNTSFELSPDLELLSSSFPPTTSRSMDLACSELAFAFVSVSVSVRVTGFVLVLPMSVSVSMIFIDVSILVFVAVAVDVDVELLEALELVVFVVLVVFVAVVDVVAVVAIEVEGEAGLDGDMIS